MEKDDITIFVMEASWEVFNRVESPPVIREQVEELERAVNNASSRTFDIAKALVESVCKTILNDRGIEVEQWDTPKLFKNTLLHLNLLSPDHPNSRKVHEGLTKTARGLYQSVQGLCELRNLEGNISHGPDGYAQGLGSTQMYFAARCADAIVNFLLKIHKIFPVDPRRGRLIFQDQKLFNEYIDMLNEPIKIFDLDFLPSEVLFYIDEDHETYRELLYEFEVTQDSEKAQELL